ncbi:hypothetical protein [Streptomyces sp. NPDC056255]|uniref:hypothetical protein n=1 Tax=Streptomyces sp. NPDC056255 TaxID=3345764 RepID=UPI0035DF3114
MSGPCGVVETSQQPDHRGNRTVNTRCIRYTQGVATAGLLALLFGCGGRHTESRSDEAPPVSRESLASAEEVLAGRCMRRQGFEYYVVVPSAGRSATHDADGKESFEYGIDDIAWATEHGFAQPSGAGTSGPVADKNARYVRSLPEAGRRKYTAAYVGDPSEHHIEAEVEGTVVGMSTTGCLATAKKALYGSLEAWFRPHVIARNVGALTRRRVLADPRYLRAAQKWSGCMRSHRINASNPDDLRRKLGRRSTSESVRDAADPGRRWAVAEATCALRTKLTETARELDSEHDAAVREKYRTELTALDVINARAVSRARGITNSP